MNNVVSGFFGKRADKCWLGLGAHIGVFAR